MDPGDVPALEPAKRVGVSVAGRLVLELPAEQTTVERLSPATAVVPTSIQQKMPFG
jgi:hypothetical protein